MLASNDLPPLPQTRGGQPAVRGLPCLTFLRLPFHRRIASVSQSIGT